MKNLNAYFLLTFFFTLTLTNCKKIDVPKDTPKCITKKIKTEKEKNCLKTVYAYDYNGQTVYFF